MKGTEGNLKVFDELNVSFGYQCTACQKSSSKVDCNSNLSSKIKIPETNFISSCSSFSCLSGAAISANVTLANTNICNGLIGEEILPGLDSPKSFRRMSSSPSLSRLDMTSSPYGSPSTLGGSVSTESDILESSRNLWHPNSAPSRAGSSSFLTALDVQTAGGAAGEDRVQAVCSEENGWLFCGVYDGFNGRDAADFLAGTLYGSIELHIQMLDWRIKQQRESNCLPQGNAMKYSSGGSTMKSGLSSDEESLAEVFRLGVLDCLTRAVAQAESDFLFMVEQEIENRPDLVSVGSSILIVLLRGRDLYVLNLGDSRAVLATESVSGNELEAIQLTEIHSVDNEIEYNKVLADHPDDPSPIFSGRVKGKLKLTRALGVGYLKKKEFNDALMGILRVRNLCDPPYVYSNPFTKIHQVSENDLFVVLGSDGLFDFFSNDEVIGLVHLFINDNPFGDPAKHLIDNLLLRAAKNAGLSTEGLMGIPLGRRRKYHDDVTVIVINLGNKQRTSKASTSL